jgi:hypothetical protein
MFFLNKQILIGPGGPLADILAGIWFALIILALFLIPRSTRIRVAERFGFGIRPRLGEPGLPASLRVRILIGALLMLLVLLMLLYGKWSRMRQ